MAELHTELLFRQLGKKFYEDCMPVIPELEFWESGKYVKHFHRFIAALSTEDQGHVIHVVLQTILSHTPEELSPQALPSERFKYLCQEFQQANFLHEARSLSSALADEQATNQLNNSDHLRVSTDAVGKHTENQLPIAQKDVNVYLFQDQLNFMSVFMKPWQNTFQDCSYTGKRAWQDMGPFKKILTGQGGNYQYHQFNQWIHTFTTEVFEYWNWLDKYSVCRYDEFENWMTRICGGI
ncbi:hypothetical protein H4Q26_006240 [Puccinia striiformis f. sp. tritici PST-130]|uniref:Uncharacterized protein n=1 Tax=Puccinia striiformis f. sp. tritici PST-78 TaxID=1165861 RepID=A0A0L0UQC1_9BASI|nr:hypothetical protein H4Q26_006240 [Puccinia striiformis f. sp. tritici PST-130]KNE89233.1 hypothetical protein PSTG_17308 [Puccinia striiformis f. sp. tritici PST-78]